VEQFQQALEPYRHLDPVGWVGVYRFFPLWMGAVGLSLSVAMLLFGGRRLFRLVAVPLGFLIASAWTTQIATHLGLGAQSKQATEIAMYVLALAGLIAPAIVVFFAVGIPAGLFAGTLVGNNDWLLGFAPAFTIAGTIGVIAHRFIGAVLSSIVGGWIFCLSALSLLAVFAGGASNWLAAHPIVVMCSAAALAVGGASYQLFIRLPPEVARDKKASDAQAKKKAKENKELEDRWMKHNSRK
jgi:hypothetical protein